MQQYACLNSETMEMIGHLKMKAGSEKELLLNGTASLLYSNSRWSRQKKRLSYVLILKGELRWNSYQLFRQTRWLWISCCKFPLVEWWCMLLDSLPLLYTFPSWLGLLYTFIAFLISIQKSPFNCCHRVTDSISFEIHFACFFFSDPTLNFYQNL